MADKKIIAVIGATGAQGGGLISALLADGGDFTPRAITRNPDSEKAVALKDLGVEVVQADTDHVDGLTEALKGAHGAFFVTNFWEHFSPEKEKQQVRNMAKAAKAAGIQHAIWSSLEDTRDHLPIDNERMPTLMDHYNVPHFDAKGETDGYFAEEGVPATVLHTSFYWDNFVYFGLGPRRGEDGKLVLGLPMDDKRLPGIAAKDIGKVALGIFKQGASTIGTKIAVAGEHLTGAEMAAQMGEALGETVNYFPVPHDMFRSFDFPGAEDMGNMFQFKVEFEEQFVGARDIEQAKAFNPELQSFKQWLDENKANIPLEQPQGA